MSSSANPWYAGASFGRFPDEDVPTPSEQEGWLAMIGFIAVMVISLLLIWFAVTLVPNSPNLLWLTGAIICWALGATLFVTTLTIMYGAGVHVYRIMCGQGHDVDTVERARECPFLFLYPAFRQAYRVAYLHARVQKATQEAKRARAAKLSRALNVTPTNEDYATVKEYLWRVHEVLAQYEHPADVVDTHAPFNVEWSKVLTAILSVSEDSHRTMADEAHALGIVVSCMRGINDPVALRVVRRKWNLDGECSLPEVDECDRIAQSAMSRLEMIRLVRIPKNGFAGEYVRLLLDILAMHGFESPFGSEVK